MVGSEVLVLPSVKTTPAMAAGVTRAPWSLTQLAELLD
jgi:hypothetical protein